MPINKKLSHTPLLTRATINKLRERDKGIIKVVLFYLAAILLLIYLSRKY